MRYRSNFSKSFLFVIILINSFYSNYYSLKSSRDNFELESYGFYGWEKSNPCFQGLSGLKIAAFKNYIQKNDLDVDYILVKNGYEIAKKTSLFPNNNANYIVTTLTATAIGLALKDDVLNFSQKVLDFFPSLNSTGYHPWTSELTIKHLLTMTAGFDISEGFNYTGDFYHNILKRSMNSRPGVVFCFDRYLYTLLAFIAGDYIEEILNTLSIFVESMSITEQGYSVGYGGMTIHFGDLSKLGYLYINNGLWENNVLITEHWINESLSKHVRINNTSYFGYSWIFNEKIGCYSSGWISNNQLFIIPEEKIVLVILGNDYSGRRYLNHYYFLIENILLNDDFGIILGFAYGFPIILGAIFVWIIIRRFKKKE